MSKVSCALQLNITSSPKNKFVPLFARRGSKLRCCEKLHVGQLWLLKEWNQRNRIQLLHNTRLQNLISVLLIPSFQ